MIDAVREKVKNFLKVTLDESEFEDAIKIIEVDHLNNNWMTVAEVAERDLAVPQHHVFKKARYVVKLTGDLEIISYKRVEGTVEE